MKRAFVGILAVLLLAGCGDVRHDQSTEEERTICVDTRSHIRYEDAYCDSGFGRWYFVPYGEWIPAVGQRTQSGFYTTTKTQTKTQTKTVTKR